MLTPTPAERGSVKTAGLIAVITAVSLMAPAVMGAHEPKVDGLGSLEGN